MLQLLTNSSFNTAAAADRRDGPLGDSALLDASAAEVTQTLAARASHTLTRSGATSGLAAQDRIGRSIVKLLDSLVRPRIRSNPALVGAWNVAIRLRRVPKTIVPAVTTPAASTSAAAPDSPAAG
jgi:hypothetical protein